MSINLHYYQSLTECARSMMMMCSAKLAVIAKTAEAINNPSVAKEGNFGTTNPVILRKQLVEHSRTLLSCLTAMLSGIHSYLSAIVPSLDIIRCPDVLSRVDLEATLLYPVMDAEALEDTLRFISEHDLIKECNAILSGSGYSTEDMEKMIDKLQQDIASGSIKEMGINTHHEYVNMVDRGAAVICSCSELFVTPAMHHDLAYDIVNDIVESIEANPSTAPCGVIAVHLITLYMARLQAVGTTLLLTAEPVIKSME